MENINEIHNIFTDDSNSCVKIDELKKYLKSKSIEEQNKILIDLINLSDKVDVSWIKKSEEYESLFSKREVGTTKKKVTEIKSISPIQKEFFSNEIEKYNNIINELLCIGVEEFTKKVMSNPYTSRDINFIILGLENEIKDYFEIAKDDYKTNNIVDIQHTEAEIDVITKKIDFLLSLKSQVEKMISESDECRIVFLQKPSGRTYFIEDVDKYNEQYKSFLGLLQSLISGKPELCKMFYGPLSGICETRDLHQQTRILFDKLDANTYIIIKAFIKKGDSKTLHKDALYDIASYFFANREKIISRLNDEEYLLEQKQILNEAINKLTKNRGC